MRINDVVITAISNLFRVYAGNLFGFSLMKEKWKPGQRKPSISSFI